LINQLILTKPWQQFSTELYQYVEKGNSLKDQPANTVEEFAELETKRLSWDKEVFEWLKESFSNAVNPMVIELHNAAANSFNIPNTSYPLKELLFQFRGRILTKINWLILKERVLNVSDAIVRPDEQLLNERAGMTLKQKQQFILEKLFDLYDDNYYPVDEILNGNGVKLNRNSEAGELATMLEGMGYLDTQQFVGQKIGAKLTTKGAIMIEESREPANENYDDIKFTSSELAQKMEEIKAELNKLGFGHEILYDELQELKNLYTTLNKKNWGQLLKGKLFDVAVSKAVDNATIAFVYKELTNHVFKLL